MVEAEESLLLVVWQMGRKVSVELVALFEAPAAIWPRTRHLPVLAHVVFNWQAGLPLAKGVW